MCHDVTRNCTSCILDVAGEARMAVNCQLDASLHVSPLICRTYWCIPRSDTRYLVVMTARSADYIFSYQLGMAIDVWLFLAEGSGLQG